jgi:LPS-assembly lipoprotein
MQRTIAALIQPIIAIGLALALGACVRPLHAPGVTSSSAVSQQLAQVAIELQGDRLAHYFRNELEFELRGGAAAPPSAGGSKYRLVVTARQTIGSTLLDRFSGLADAATLTVNAEYALFRTGTTESINTGTAIAIVSYERSQQRFASQRAARDAEIQSARQLAEQIRNRVATFLSANP